uniref:Phosphoribosyl-ATP pyrophosphatase n=1 Tax=Fervidicoccus fontis TaxID=683846 RepID=A0A7J3ZLL8_9CREN
MNGSPNVIVEVYETIRERKEAPRKESYTATLFSKGLNAILKKLGEETVEVAVAASSSSREQLVHEVTDLIFHLLVLLAYKDIHVSEIFSELERRRR